MRARILNASAGSGKTYQLAYKYVRDVVERPDIYRHILAVTFTNKATEEMKSRILREIHTLASDKKSSYTENLCRELRLDEHTVRQRAKEVRSKILHDYSRFTVLTIDTFFQRILRAFIKELGIDLNYNIEIETSSVLTKSADTLIEQITTDPTLLQWLTEFVQERIDEGRKWDIRDGILSLGGELFKEKNKEVLASAHSKEELGRIVGETAARATATKQQMQAAACEAVRIMHEAGVSTEDFTGKSRSFTNYFTAVATDGPKPYTATVAKMSLTTEGWCAKGSPAAPIIGRLQPLLREMCDTYDHNIRTWNTCDLLRENYRSFALLTDLYAKVQQMCDEQNVMLLSETKYILSEFIGHNDAPFIYEKVGNRFERFMIDEFQDTSVKEWENFLPLLENAMAQAKDISVLIVGDIKQSIYRWRGGDWRLLHSEAQEALDTESTEVVVLKENYRSLPTIVEFNNRIIGRIVAADNAALDTTVAEATARGDIAPSLAERLHGTLAGAYREHAQTPRRKGLGYVSVSTFGERPPVVERICEILDKGFRPCDIMILVRGATDGAKVAAELLAFKGTNNDPHYRFDVMTQEALIVGNAPISSFVIASLRLALNPSDSLSRAVYNHYLGYSFDTPLSEQAEAFFRTIRLLSPEEAFERIVIEHQIDQHHNQIAYLQAIHDQIIAFSAHKIADIPLFLRYWDEQGQNRSLSVGASDSAIEITTIHKAKGLEKRVVLIPYCSWQLDPKSGGNIQNIVWAEVEDRESTTTTQITTAQADSNCVRSDASGVNADTHNEHLRLKSLGRFPVKYKKSMAESGFSSAYYRELVYAHVDNINLLYVALTRAAESLHIFVPQKGGKTVGAMLTQSIAVEDNRAEIAGLEGRYTSSEEGEQFEFGEFTGPVKEDSKQDRAEHIVLEHYRTAQADLQLRLPSQRYFEQGDQVELSPRNFGILMHRAFEQADTTEEIEQAIIQMEADATLSSAEATELRRLICEALAHPAAQEWFGGGWRQVRNENEIITPGGALRRPDRVMIRGTHAVVVDYKFGAKDDPRYHTQIHEYLSLLHAMGYTQAEGYLWYVRRGEIVRVEIGK